MDKEEQINVRNVDPDLKRRAQVIALQTGRNLSDVIRELLQKWTAEQEKKLKQQSQ
jgi:plasmid stability protein